LLPSTFVEAAFVSFGAPVGFEDFLEEATFGPAYLTLIPLFLNHYPSSFLLYASISDLSLFFD